MRPDPRPHYLLDRMAGWRAGHFDLARLSSCGDRLELEFAPAAMDWLADANGDFGGLTLPKGYAVDARGQVYRVAQDTVELLNPCGNAFGAVGCFDSAAGARRLVNASGLAISSYGDLYIADPIAAKIKIFTVRGFALRAVWKAPKAWPKWRPEDVAVKGGRVYVADSGHNVVHLFRRDGTWVAAFDGAAAPQGPLQKPTRIVIGRSSNLYAVQDSKREVVVLDSHGAYLQTVKLAREVSADFCAPPPPLPAPPALAGPPPAKYVRSGVFWSSALDSAVYQCVWHRIALDLSIPPGTRVRIHTMSAEAEKPMDEILAIPETRWATAQTAAAPGEGAWDCLVQGTPGRYLWVRFQLEGDGFQTPEIRRARIYYPRRSSLRHLPAVYGQDQTSSAFLDQFLSIFDRFFENTGDVLKNFALFLDPMATPGDFLPWLAGWMGLTFENSWPEEKRRRLLREAHRIYKWRGTRLGLQIPLSIYTGSQPEILEEFQARRWFFMDSARLGEQRAVWGPEIVRRLQLDQFSTVGDFQLIDSNDPLRDPFFAGAYRFSVFVRLGREPSDLERAAIESIVEMAKPAHTLATIRILRPRFRIGVQSTVGIDTAVARYPSGVVEGEGRVGYDAVLGPSPGGERPPGFEIGSPRIGMNTVID